VAKIKKMFNNLTKMYATINNETLDILRTCHKNEAVKLQKTKQKFNHKKNLRNIVA